MTTSSRPDPPAGTPLAGPPAPAAVAALQIATRVLTGVALRSLEVLDGAVTLPRFRLLAVLSDQGQVRSVEVARALGLDASTVTRLADRLVAAGYVIRGAEMGHRGVVTLELTPAGQRLVDRVTDWRDQELTRILRRLPEPDQEAISGLLTRLVEAAGESYGAIIGSPVPF